MERRNVLFLARRNIAGGRRKYRGGEAV